MINGSEKIWIDQNIRVDVNNIIAIKYSPCLNDHVFEYGHSIFINSWNRLCYNPESLTIIYDLWSLGKDNRVDPIVQAKQL